MLFLGQRKHPKVANDIITATSLVALRIGLKIWVVSFFKVFYSIKIDMAFTTEFPKQPEKDAGFEPSDWCIMYSDVFSSDLSNIFCRWIRGFAVCQTFRVQNTKPQGGHFPPPPPLWKNGHCHKTTWVIFTIFSAGLLKSGKKLEIQPLFFCQIPMLTWLFCLN